MRVCVCVCVQNLKAMCVVSEGHWVWTVWTGARLDPRLRELVEDAIGVLQRCYRVGPAQGGRERRDTHMLSKTLVEKALLVFDTKN